MNPIAYDDKIVSERNSQYHKFWREGERSEKNPVMVKSFCMVLVLRETCTRARLVRMDTAPALPPSPSKNNTTHHRDVFQSKMAFRAFNLLTLSMMETIIRALKEVY